MIRALKGAPMSILVALMISDGKVGEAWLSRVTGYSEKTVRNGCKYLEEIQLIQRIGRYEGYRIMDGIMQLALQEQDQRERENLPLDTTTTTTTLNSKKRVDSEEKAAAAIKGAVKITARNKEGTVKITARSKDGRDKLLKAAGIMEPTASRIKQKYWATEEYLKAHIDKAKKENLNVSLLIHRIESHDPMPKNGNEKTPEDYRNSWLKEY
jgi:hypothetical protein